MSKHSFTSRPFDLSASFVRKAEKILVQEKSLTPLMHEYKGRLDDYELARGWLKTLTGKFNWIGNTMMFNLVLDYYLKERSGNTRYRQTMFEQNGRPVGYSRVLNLSMNTLTRNDDCAKIEETLVCGQPHIADPALLVHMHDVIAADARAQGKKRLITELGVGFSPKKFNSVARQIKILSGDPAQAQEVARLRRMFDRDWVAVTVDFAHKIGFEITDIAMPPAKGVEINPQLRISRDLGNGTPKALPPLIFNGRECFRFKGEKSLKPVRDYMADIRDAAARKYGIE